VISSWAQTYHTDEPASAARSGALASSLRKSLTTASDGHPGPAGLALLLLLIGYAPFVATIAAQVRENGVRWTLAGVGTCLVTSWVVAVTVFQVGKVIT